MEKTIEKLILKYQRIDESLLVRNPEFKTNRCFTVSGENYYKNETFIKDLKKLKKLASK